MGDGTDCGSTFCNPPVSGACCLSPFGGCVQTDFFTCRDFYGGFYRGDGTDCELCPPPEGACCFANFTCESFLSQSSCQFQGGTWQGAGTTCNTMPCIPLGACCFGLSCQDGYTESDCVSQGSTYLGGPSSCFNFPCPLPTALLLRRRQLQHVDGTRLFQRRRHLLR